jgi:hypothetical protein
MPLWWIVHEIDGERRIFIQKADGLIFARLYAAVAGFVRRGAQIWRGDRREGAGGHGRARAVGSRGEGVAGSHDR